jgi:predicted dehydrogenase
MSRVHAAAATAAGADLYGLASSTPARAEAAAEAFGIDRTYDTVDELLASDIDVVHVCTPNATHATYARQALLAGKHVICEKPLATTAQDACELTALANDRGLTAVVPFAYRYHPMVREAQARVAAGGIGRLFSLDCHYLQDWMLLPTDSNWRTTQAGGGASRAFADIGSHLCDLIEFVTGERIVRLTSRTKRVHTHRAGMHVDNEDSVALIIEMASGAIGSLLISQAAAGRKNAMSIELHGSNHSLRFDQENPEQLWMGGRQSNIVLTRDPNTASPGVARFSKLPAGHPQGYQDAFNALISDAYTATRGQAPVGLPNFNDGLRAAALTEAVLLSSADGTWAEIGSA